MIQLNLLPSVKAEYVKAQRTKRTVITLAFIISAIAIAIVVLLGAHAYGYQRFNLSRLQNDIDNKVSKVNEVENLDGILTVQNQLISVEGLHDSKPVAKRMFTYVQQTTPNEVTIDTYAVEFDNSTMSVIGGASNLESVNKFIDTLKFTVIDQPGMTEDDNPQYAFSDVVLSEFSSEDGDVTYGINFSFNPMIYNSDYEDLVLVVPNKITTRSETLFEKNREEGEAN